MAVPTAQEQQYYDQLFDLVDKDGSGILPGSEAFPFLTSSGLPQQTLGEVWAIADPDNNGFLTKDGLYKVARLVGWMQSGKQSQVEPSLVNKPGPYPKFAGYPPPPVAPQLTGTASPNPAGGAHGLPPLTPSDRAQFTRIFAGTGPVNGLVAGDKARDVFLKSQLSYDKLGLIWNLADTQQRGALDLTDFVIGMWLIRSAMANPSTALPQTLPPGAYETASGGRAPPRPTSPLSHQHTGGTSSPIQRQLTGTLQPQVTGQNFGAPLGTPPRSNTLTPSRQSTGPAAFGSAPVSSSASTIPWDVTAEAKATSDRFFAQLDSQNRGVIEGDVAVPFMLQSQLDEGTLASIWDLSDIREEGKLDRDEFAVAMYLINSKLTGKELPTVLPLSLVPPSLRASHGRAATQAPPADNTKDLFDLFDEAPESTDNAAPPAAFLPLPPSRRATQEPSRQTSRAVVPPSNLAARPAFALPQAQPGNDLLGDDGAETAATSALDKSAELGNKKNQLDNTARSVTALEKDHAELESQTASNAQALEKLESDLTAARGKHDAETKAVSDLRIRVGEQTAKLKQLQADVISAESDLTAMRLEKDELEQSLLRDKEEVRSLQKRMKEVEDEKTGLKLLLDKTKKDARQQKGMVTIAKKQLSTAESSRDSVQQDVRLAEQELEEATAARAEGVASPSSVASAAAVPLPHTPQTLSPEPTGVSQRSNNPFDRFSRSSLSRATQSPELSPTTTAAFAGVGAGIVGGSAIAAAAALSGAEHSDSHGAHEEVSVPAGAAPDAEASVDPFNAPSDFTAPTSEKIAAESDPFGAAPGSTSQSDEPAVSHDATASHGFGDSFGAPVDRAIQEPHGEQHNATDHQAAPTDFDSAFADFDTPAEAVEGPADDDALHPTHPSVHDEAEHSLPADTLPVATDTLPVAALSHEAPEIASVSAPTASTSPTVAAVAPPLPAAASHEPTLDPTTERAAHLDGGESSDEDEGPEDIEAPRRNYTSPPPDATDSTSPTSPKEDRSAAEGPADEVHAKTRRSAPPPPVSRTPASGTQVPTGTAIFDPFGAPVGTESSAHQAPAPKSTQFDDEDDFDFTDLPASHAEGQQGGAVSAFDDEFASFDDFASPASQVGTGSDNSNSLLQTYEVVSSKAGQHEADSGLDEWGVSTVAALAAPAAAAPALSFDDAFGGDFSSSFNTPSQPAPAPAPAPAASAPELPKRPSLGTGVSDLPQADDLEDVKRLCAMGFPRSLVVEALDANGYDFQKALNVLLVK